MIVRRLLVLACAAQALCGCGAEPGPSGFGLQQGARSFDSPAVDVHGFVVTLSSGAMNEQIASGVTMSGATCFSLSAVPGSGCRLSWSITMLSIRPQVAHLRLELIEGGKVEKVVSARIRPPGLQPKAVFIGQVREMVHKLEQAPPIRALTIAPVAIQLSYANVAETIVAHAAAS